MTDALDQSAVEAVAALARTAQDPKVVAGKYYFGSHLQRLDTDPRLPEPLEFLTLDGFTQLLHEDASADHTLVHVVSPTLVRAIGELEGDDDHLRPCYGYAQWEPQIRNFQFNALGTLDGLAIALQTAFEDGGRLAELRAFCASVRATEEVGVADDGVSQTVQAKRGIAAIQNVAVTNPWLLAPYRTFAEVPQPLSPYVLRFEKRGEGELRAGLFETGESRWQVEAVRTIAGYLRAQLGTGWRVLG